MKRIKSDIRRAQVKEVALRDSEVAWYDSYHNVPLVLERWLARFKDPTGESSASAA
jgi:hypothetical protein